MKLKKYNSDYHSKLPKFIISVKNFLSRIKFPPKLIFIIIGLFSTIWFLVRVIPKPSRAEYPCMKAAYPLMTGFVAYLLGLIGAVLAFGKSKKHFTNARYLASAVFLIIAIFSFFISSTNDSIPVYANSKFLLGPNTPIGVAKGIIPGRVVWVWDPTSTNENCTNSFGDGWFMDKNTNMSVVFSMTNEAVKKITNKPSVKESWDALFRYFNQNHGKGSIGYSEGEKIFIRTNQVSASSGTYNTSDFSIKDQSRYGMAETSPQVVLAILRQLIDTCGVKQQNISLGDPMKHMYKHFFDLLHNEFPNVTYIDSDARLGRTAPVKPASPSIYYSDRGTILKEDGTTGNVVTSDYFPTVITEANYMIIIPALKAHARGGVTLNAKIHFGSNLFGSATHLHGGLVAPNKENVNPMRTNYGMYRVQVDLMGDKYLGGNTILFIVDGLWGGSEANDPPRKFTMTPFNNDWTSSIFMSQDQVALESVCFDFLKAEYTSQKVPFYGDYPQMPAVDDYINQAADSSFWPQGFKYDPENDGVQIHSLGVCEHWNNEFNKQYTRNLNTGNGIELAWINKSQTAVLEDPDLSTGFSLNQNYPNPFNPSTVIGYSLKTPNYTTMKIYDITGKEIETLVHEYQTAGYHTVQFSASKIRLASGIYYYKLTSGSFTQAKKMILMK